MRPIRATMRRNRLLSEAAAAAIRWPAAIRARRFGWALLAALAAPAGCATACRRSPPGLGDGFRERLPVAEVIAQIGPRPGAAAR